ncbi:MAG: NUDIX hydrolase [Microgenomates bacterium 39_7]|nr:MAG: NUDIX hydrolase [Microgenomates bacterium 39_7]
MHQYFAKNYIFCPRCGTRFEKKEEHLHCPQCQFRVYPSPTPATAVFILNQKNELLLGERKIDPQKGYWDAIGGFVEPEESVEKGAIREAKEESNLDVKIDYILGTLEDTYQGKPTFTVALVASVIGGEPKAKDDVAQLRWFDLNQLPTDDEIAFESVKVLLKKLKNKLT